MAAQGKPTEAHASVRFVRMTPNKVRFMLDQIRGLRVEEAERILTFSPRAASAELGKVLHAAVANARTVLNAEPEELMVSRCWADEGITLKRFQPRAQGRAYRIRKRTSHITICVKPAPSRPSPKRGEKKAAKPESKKAAKPGSEKAPRKAARASKKAAKKENP